jgi:hypothetical protein
MGNWREGLIDDRDPIIQNLPPEKRLPPYGPNSLHSPGRALSSEECAAAFDACGIICVPVLDTTEAQAQ